MLLAACSDSSDGNAGPAGPVTTQGALNTVVFAYGCVGPGDAQCNADSDLAPVGESSTFPDLAVGASAKISAAYAPGASSDGGTLTLDSVGGDYLTVGADGTTVTAVKAGTTDFIARVGGAPVDYALVNLKPVDHIKLLEASPQGDFKGGTISIGSGGVSAQANVTYTFKFRVVPVDGDGHILAGAFPIAWSSTNDSIVKLTSAANDNVATFQSGSAGHAAVHVTLGTFSGDIAITVGS